MFHIHFRCNLNLVLNQFPVFCLQRITGACLSPLPGQCYVGSSGEVALDKHCSQMKIFYLFCLFYPLRFPLFFSVKPEN